MAEDSSWQERRRRALEIYGTLRGDPALDVEQTVAGIEAVMGAIGSFSFDHVLGDIWSRPELSRRDRSLVSVTALTCTGSVTELRTHLGGALNHGASAEELEEVMLQISGYAGFPRALEGMRVAMTLFGEREDVERPLPRPAPERKDDARRREDGSEVFERMTAGAMKRASVAEMMEAQLGAFGRFGLLYLFGEIWARPQLSRRDRSLVTLVVLVSLGKITELRVHVPAALHHGMTRLEIEEIILQLTLYVGFPTALEALRATQEIFRRHEAAEESPNAQA